MPANSDLQRMLDSLASTIEDQMANSHSNRSRLYDNVFTYYRFLQRRFPADPRDIRRMGDQVSWDGDSFEYTEWRHNLALSYSTNSGELEYTPPLFKKGDTAIAKMLDMVSTGKPPDVMLYVPSLDIKVPFLDVKTVGLWSFAW